VAASTFANLAKRKPVGSSTTIATPEKTDKERPSSSKSSSNNSLHQLQQHDDHSSHSASANTNTQQDRTVPRRKSSAGSATSQHPPSLPKRRQRQSSASLHSNSNRHSALHDGAGEEVFVVEAPLAEVSAPPSPAVGVSKQLGDDEGRSENGKSAGKSEEVTGSVSQGSSLRSNKADEEVGRGTFPFA
jgi:hypothetical protein